MAAHRREQILLGRAGGEIELRIERVEREHIAVRAGRRTRAAVSDLAKVVLPLAAAAPDLIACGHPFGQSGGRRGKAVNHPMDPDAGRRVRVVADEREALRRRRDSAPGQGWRDVLSVARVLRRNRASFRERGASQFQSHGTSHNEKEAESEPQRPSHFFGVDPAAGRAGGTPMSRQRFFFSSQSASARFRFTAAAAARASSSLAGGAAGFSFPSATPAFYGIVSRLPCPVSRVPVRSH